MVKEGELAIKEFSIRESIISSRHPLLQSTILFVERRINTDCKKSTFLSGPRLIDSFLCLTTHLSLVFCACSPHFTSPQSSLYITPYRQFASNHSIWQNTAYTKGLGGVRPHRRLDRLSEGDKNVAVEIFALIWGALLSSLFWQPALELYIPQLSGGISLMRSSGNLWKKKKIPKGGKKKTEGSESRGRGCACCTKNEWKGYGEVWHLREQRKGQKDKWHTLKK